MNRKLLPTAIAILLLISACSQAATEGIPLQTSTSIADSLSPSAVPGNAPISTPLTPPTPDNTTSATPSPTETPNASALLSPDGKWAALGHQAGLLRISRTDDSQEYTITCDLFPRCEFIVPLQWSPDSQWLYLGTLLTGETNIPFDLYPSIARISMDTGQLEKLAENPTSDGTYDLSLSPDGKYLAYTEIGESRPILHLIETQNPGKTFDQNIDHGFAAGNLLWTPDSEGIVFVSVINCESSVHFFDLRTRKLATLIDRDPTCIHLSSINANDQVILSKQTDSLIPNSDWYLDLSTSTLIEVSPTPE